MPGVIQVPSNYEQSIAIGLALDESSPLQVVSGPPGTGKSQLIQNLIINAISQKKRVLLSSHTNNAVDIVVNRLNEGGLGFPVILRLGSDKFERKAAETLEELSTNCGGKQICEIEEVSEWKRGLRQVSDKLKRMYNHRVAKEKADEVLQRIEDQLDGYRESHSDLYEIADWTCDQSGQFEISKWKKQLARYYGLKAASKSVFARFRTCLREGFSWKGILDPDFYFEALRHSSLKRMRRVVPEWLLSTLEEKELLDPTPDFLTTLETLLALSVSYKQAFDVTVGFKMTEFLSEWEQLELERIPFATKMLQHSWQGNLSGAKFKDATGFFNRGKDESKFDAILDVFPACATTSLSVGRIPFSAGVFDYAIIDEASQADVASTLPVLFRARKAVVIGDEMQLRPVITLEADLSDALLEAFDLVADGNRRFDIQSTSLLDLAESNFRVSGGRRVLLKDHYRSHPDIISFSNERFYNGELRIRTDRKGRQGFFFEDVQGVVEPRWVNHREAQRVLTLVSSWISSGAHGASIGVVTPFRAQADIIRRLLAGIISNDKRYENILVDTANGFQGSERNYMVFSLVVGPGMPSGSIRWVNSGPNSKNLLNVAITRARKELHIVGNRSMCLEVGGLLGKFVSHADSCARLALQNQSRGVMIATSTDRTSK